MKNRTRKYASPSLGGTRPNIRNRRAIVRLRRRYPGGAPNRGTPKKNSTAYLYKRRPLRRRFLSRRSPRHTRSTKSPKQYHGWPHPRWETRLPQTSPRRLLSTSHLPPASRKNGSLAWIQGGIRETLAISIRPARWIAMRKRFGPWARYITRFAGTNGHARRLRGTQSAGQLGCYDSHVRVWRRIAAGGGTRPTLVFEDDVALWYDEQISRRFQHLIRALRTVGPWDICYVCNKTKPGFATLTVGIGRALPWNGLYGYLLTPTGAKKLLRHATPPRSAVDIFVAKEVASGRVRGVRADPGFGFVVPVRSDTLRNPK